jgi:hypothetical protein
MPVSRSKFSFLLSLLLILFSITITARADDDEPDEYDVKARVVRLSLIDGEVNLKRNGNQDWERARVNYPLVEGDTLATGKDSRLEIQVDPRNFVRLAAGTAPDGDGSIRNSNASSSPTTRRGSSGRRSTTRRPPA